MRRLLTASTALTILMGSGIVFAQELTVDSPQERPQVVFPIAELGDCSSKEACRAYCSNPTHQDACIAYGETHGLMKKEEAQKARQVIGKKGPGGCTDKAACQAYCDDTAHTEECLAFAKEHKLISEKEIQIYEKLRASGGPGQCINQKECRTYCSDPAHHEECARFAQENGLTPPGGGRGPQGDDFEARLEGSEREQLRGKINGILAQKPGPGGCTSVDECKRYCTDPANTETCMKFGEENGLMTGDEAQRARQMSRESGPGGCKGAACRDYCAIEEHVEECVAFAEKRGLMDPGQAQNARTLMSRPGPGGCIGEACRDYCADPAHHEECRQFAMENGFMPRDEQGQFENNPARMGPPTGTPGMMTGPGGCKNREECEAFCKANPDQCRMPGQGESVQQRAGMPTMGTRPEGARGASMPQGVPDPMMRERCVQFGGSWDGQRCIKPEGMTAPASGQMPTRPSVPTDGYRPEGGIAPNGYEQKNYMPQNRYDQNTMPADGYVRPEMNPGSDGGQRMPYMPSTMQDPARTPMPPYPTPVPPAATSPSSMTPLSMFTASVFAVFQGLLK